MKIARVECHVLRVPVPVPLLERPVPWMTNVLKIETDDGLTGWAEAGSPIPHAVREFINRVAAPVLEGMDPFCTEQIRSTLFMTTTQRDPLGAWAWATGLIDIACWDIKGKALGAPVWKLLGGARSRVPVYTTFGLPRYTRDQLVEAARRAVRDQGFDKLKMVVGAGSSPHGELFGNPTEEDLREDVERVRAVRSAIGDDVALMIDANKNLHLAQARRLAAAVAPFDIFWFEDPVLNADPLLLAAFRRQSPMPVAAGGTGLSDLTLMRELLLQESVDIIQPNVRDIGGYTQGVKAAAMAEAFGVQFTMGGGWPLVNMHLHAGVGNGGLIEIHALVWALGELLFEKVPTLENGWMTLPEEPGLGVKLKDGVLNEWAVE